MTYPSPFTVDLPMAFASEVQFSIRSCGPSPVWLAKYPADTLLKDHGNWSLQGTGHVSPPLRRHMGGVWCDRCRYVVGT